MADWENDEVLPEGWRVEFRVRKNGKKDKIIFEKATAEGLPPGWTKEIKVTKTGRKVRRDSYYIDPVSGYIFRSMKDAVRYVETGEVGRLAFKPKDEGNQDEEDLEDDKDNSPIAAKKQKLAVAGTGADITRSTKLSEVAKDEDALDSVSTGEGISRTEHTSGKGSTGTESRGPIFSEVKDSDKMDEGKDSDKNVLSTSVVGVLPDRQLSDSAEVRDETKKTIHEKCRSKKKKALDLPRRASKRLAGLEIDPTPELKTNNQARRAVAKLSDEIEATTVEDPCSGSQVHLASQQSEQLEAKPEANCAFHTSKSIEVLSESSDSKHPSGDSSVPSGKIETEYKSDQKQGCTVTLPFKNQGKIETDIEVDKKLGPPIDLTFRDLLSDPCIAFAIKTLTGETFETSSDKEVSQESNISKSEGLTTVEDFGGKQRENEGIKKQNLAMPGEQAANIDSNLKADEKLENPLDLPFADIWGDPCIEFAIKTLTGTIPVGNDLDVQDYFQQQVNSSQTQDVQDYFLQQVNSSQTQPSNNNFCQTEFLCQQYDSLEKPVSREQARTGNLIIPNPGGTSFHQESKKRSNECH